MDENTGLGVSNGGADDESLPDAGKAELEIVHDSGVDGEDELIEVESHAGEMDEHGGVRSDEMNGVDEPNGDDEPSDDDDEMDEHGEVLSDTVDGDDETDGDNDLQGEWLYRDETGDVHLVPAEL